MQIKNQIKSFSAVSQLTLNEPECRIGLGHKKSPSLHSFTFAGTEIYSTRYHPNCFQNKKPLNRFI